MVSKTRGSKGSGVEVDFCCLYVARSSVEMVAVFGHQLQNVVRCTPLTLVRCKGCDILWSQAAECKSCRSYFPTSPGIDLSIIFIHISLLDGCAHPFSVSF